MVSGATAQKVLYHEAGPIEAGACDATAAAFPGQAIEAVGKLIVVCGVTGTAPASSNLYYFESQAITLGTPIPNC